MSDNNDFTHEFQIFSTDQNAGTMGTGKFMLYDNNINALKIETIDNIKIGGGSNGRVLATDGNGNLRWISAAAVTGGVSSYNDLEDLPDLSLYALNSSLATVATSGDYDDLTGKPTLFSGSYTDLTNKPTLFSGNYNDLTNKPTIPVVPTNVSSFANDAGYLTSVTNISGNAATVSNGVYTTGSYANPAWITSLAYSKLTGAPTIPNLAAVNEHILPTTDVTYDLGSPTKQWRSLYLSGSTIYLGGTALSVDSSGNFSIDGNTVINSSGAAVDIDWNDITNKPAIPVDIGDLTDTGNLLGSGGGGGATTLSALTDVALEGPVEGSVLTWNSSQNKWENRSLPSSNEITNTDGMNTYAVSVSTTGIVTMTTARGSLEFGAQPEEGAPQHLHIMRPVGQSGATDLYFGDDYNYFKLPGNYGVGTLGVDIGANDLNGGNQYVWRFGTDGNLTVPGNIYGPNNGSTLVLGQAVDSNNAFVSIPSFADGGELLTIQNNFNADTGGIQVNTNGYLDLNGKTVNLNGSTSITAIAGSYQWRFNNDGRFQLPTNGIIQQNGSYTRTTTPGINGATTNEVVWTSLYNDISSAKLTIQLETNEVDDTTGWHTQVCEAIIASRGSVIGGDPIMTVYGVTYTSTVPLVTFTVQRNPTTQLIEVVATRTAATVEGISFRIHSVEMKTRD